MLRAASLAILMASVPLSAQAAEEEWKVKDMHLEFGGFAGLLLPSSRHEFYDTALPHRELSGVAPDFGLRAAFFPIKYAGVELEGALMPTGIEGASGGLLYGLRAHAVVQYPLGRLTPFGVLGTGLMGLSSNNTALGNDNDPEFHVGLGAKYYFTSLLGARLDGRYIAAPGLAASAAEDSNTGHWELLVGLTVALWRNPEGPPDTDEDGIPDAQDKCRLAKGTAPDGCPNVDTDGDGIKDALDQCPKVKGDMASGCPRDSDDDGIADMRDKCPKEAGPAPDGCPNKDSDADGILDNEDKCPNVAGDAPTGCPPDRDGDGVYDDKDACPSIPGTEANGCPPDGDGDGVWDADDKCPAEPETKNQFQDTDGCPDELPKEVTKFVGAIKGINFQSGRSKIRASSYRTLNEAVAVLKKFPGVRLEVSGHTDSQGDDTTNLDLSKARADAVKEYIVSKGIDPTRLETVGYGETQPRASNDDATGRAENRRIEFKLLGAAVAPIKVEAPDGTD